jgi:hypothetical protein
MGFERPVVQADGTWYSQRRGARVTGIVAELTVPAVRAAVAGQAVWPRAQSATPPLRRLPDLRNRLIAGDPDPMRDRGELASHGDGGALQPWRLATETPEARRRDRLRVRLISTDAAS